MEVVLKLGFLSASPRSNPTLFLSIMTKLKN